ncbi:hypothetical protein A6D6_03138 [Alcanivorax xiamenensis]|uniref:Uncharacterized protein n=1 Tax=Alcanivorax xiamenensis TaxID=1177156 RepID=A0ABQ6Y593_9GAMM|nr:hypothetical protein [Alcanivorax xiamenensis]KAF0804401.1 hypothetical protein A6D6_03138 [Alcanivorax xiamenensis]
MSLEALPERGKTILTIGAKPTVAVGANLKKRLRTGDRLSKTDLRSEKRIELARALGGCGQWLRLTKMKLWMQRRCGANLGIGLIRIVRGCGAHNVVEGIKIHVGPSGVEREEGPESLDKARGQPVITDDADTDIEPLLPDWVGLQLEGEP